MKTCARIRGQIAFYLDGELGDAERRLVARHLDECDSCRAAVDAERAFLDSVREAAPLHTASPELRARVAEILEAAPAPHRAPERLRRSVSRLLGVESSKAARRRKYASLAAAAVLVLVLGGGVWLADRLSASPLRAPSASALMAVDTHARYVRGQLPLEVATRSPEAISSWFAGKVPFGLKLPNYQEASGQELLYRIEGARLVGFEGDYAAFVTYRMGTRPISLVVTSNEVAMPSGGEEIQSRGLVFHFDVIDGLKVISWSDRGLTYALVSDLEERGQQSCFICHVGTKDRDFVETLKPR
jgi:anti-sigma factor RsiW